MVIMRVKKNYRIRLNKIKDRVREKTQKRERFYFEKQLEAIDSQMRISVEKNAQTFAEFFENFKRITKRQFEEIRVEFEDRSKVLKGLHDKEVDSLNAEVERKNKEKEQAIQRADNAKERYFERIEELTKIGFSMRSVFEKSRRDKERLAKEILSTLADKNELEHYMQQVDIHKQKAFKSENLQIKD